MKRLKNLLLIASFVLTSCGGTTQAPLAPERTSLFEMGEAGSKYYRIPALVKAQDGALVAIADKRGDALGDSRTSLPSFRNEAPTTGKPGAT